MTESMAKTACPVASSAIEQIDNRLGSSNSELHDMICALDNTKDKLEIYLIGNQKDDLECDKAAGQPCAAGIASKIDEYDRLRNKLATLLDRLNKFI